jgi:hypothetical protein
MFINQDRAFVFFFFRDSFDLKYLIHICVIDNFFLNLAIFVS